MKNKTLAKKISQLERLYSGRCKFAVSHKHENIRIKKETVSYICSQP